MGLQPAGHPPGSPAPAPPGASGPSPKPERVAELRRAAHDYVQRVVGVSIDTSEESLAFVDHYLEQVRRQGPVGDDALRLLACALGVHLGEVAIGKFGGCWQREEPVADDDPATDALGFRVALSQVPLVFAPVGMAAAAIRQGEVEGFDDSVNVPGEFTEALSAALSRVTMTEEEYYSLTGRLEGLAYAVDVLAELLHQQAAPPPTEGEPADRN